MAAERPEYDEQDGAEVLDEDNLLPDSDRVAGGDDGLTFEGMPNVFDATSARGDSDIDGDDEAMDADEESDELLRTLGDEGEDDDDLDDDNPRDALDDDDLTRETLDVDFEEGDLVDGTARLARDEVELIDVDDTDSLDARARGGAAGLSAADLESDTLSDEDLMELDYKDPTTGETRGGAGDVERGTGSAGPGADVERASGQAGARTADVERGAGSSATGGRGPGGEGGQKYADVAAADLPPDHPAHPEREDERLEEALEETFPASDPVSAKHIT